MRACVCVSVCVRLCVHVCVRACVRVCEGGGEGRGSSRGRGTKRNSTTADDYPSLRSVAVYVHAMEHDIFTACDSTATCLHAVKPLPCRTESAPDGSATGARPCSHIYHHTQIEIDWSVLRSDDRIIMQLFCLQLPSASRLSRTVTSGPVASGSRLMKSL